MLLYRRGPNKYTRKWEDEGAYSKPTPQRKPRPEDFPALGSRSSKRNPDESFKENNSDELNKRYSKNNSESPRSPIHQKRSFTRKDREMRIERNYDRNNDRNERGGDRNDRMDRNERERHERIERNNERIERNSERNIERNERFDRNNRDDRNDRGGNDRMDRGGDRNNDRNTGYRAVRNTLEFKNQNRIKPNIESNSNNNKDLINTRNQDIRYITQQNQAPSSPPMETMSFTNTKLARSNDKALENFNRNSRDREFKPSNISGRIQAAQSGGTLQHQQNQMHLQQQFGHPTQPQQHQMSSSNSSQRHQQNIHINQNIPNINQLQNPQLATANPSQMQTQHMQSVPHQMQASMQQQQQQQNIIGESSRPKRYSSFRQKSINDTPQGQSNAQSHPLVTSNSSPQLQQHEQLIHEQTLLQQQQLMQMSQDSMNKYQQKLHLQQQQSDMKSVQGQNIISQIAMQPQPPQTQQPTTAATGQGQYAGTFFSQTPATEYNPQPVQAVNVPQGSIVTQPTTNPQIIANPQYSGQYPPPPPQGTSTSYIQTPPGAYIPQPTTHHQPQIINIVPTQTQYPTPPQYVNFQNYPPAIPPPKAPPSGIYQTQGGLTFFAPQTQTQPRPILPQRRPTNAIPIVAPQERGGKGRGRAIVAQYDDADEMSQDPSAPPLGSAENIDHILDNMFVQRAPYQPPTTRKSPPSEVGAGAASTTATGAVVVSSVADASTKANAVISTIPVVAASTPKDVPDKIENSSVMSTAVVANSTSDVNDIEKSIKVC